MSIPCRYKNGAPVSPAEADMIMRALGFGSAMQAEEVIGAAERRRKERKRKAHQETAAFRAEIASLTTERKAVAL